MFFSNALIWPLLGIWLSNSSLSPARLEVWVVAFFKSYFGFYMISGLGKPGCSELWEVVGTWAAVLWSRVDSDDQTFHGRVFKASAKAP